MISVFARMLERLAHDNLSEIVKANNFLTSSQGAFCRLCSTTTATISSAEHCHENMDSNKLNLTIFLEFRQDFDAVDH